MVDDAWKDEVSVLDVDDVLALIKSDYEKAYFVTGNRIGIHILFIILRMKETFYIII